MLMLANWFLVVTFWWHITQACVPPSRTPPEWEQVRDYADYESDYFDPNNQGFGGVFATIGTSSTLPPNIPNPGTCGTNYYTQQRAQPSRINVDALPLEVPWQVNLIITTRTQTYACGGALINKSTRLAPLFQNLLKI